MVTPSGAVTRRPEHSASNLVCHLADRHAPRRSWHEPWDGEEANALDDGEYTSVLCHDL
jgi:hypothetical protein